MRIFLAVFALAIWKISEASLIFTHQDRLFVFVFSVAGMLLGLSVGVTFLAPGAMARAKRGR